MEGQPTLADFRRGWRKVGYQNYSGWGDASAWSPSSPGASSPAEPAPAEGDPPVPGWHQAATYDDLFLNMYRGMQAQGALPLYDEATGLDESALMAFGGLPSGLPSKGTLEEWHNAYKDPSGRSIPIADMTFAREYSPDTGSSWELAKMETKAGFTRDRGKKAELMHGAAVEAFNIGNFSKARRHASMAQIYYKEAGDKGEAVQLGKWMDNTLKPAMDEAVMGQTIDYLRARDDEMREVVEAAGGEYQSLFRSAGSDYVRPPRPLAEDSEGEGLAWDLAERIGAPYHWDENASGPTPRYITERWVDPGQRFSAHEYKRYINEVLEPGSPEHKEANDLYYSHDWEAEPYVYEGERRPEHQAALDKMKAKAEAEAVPEEVDPLEDPRQQAYLNWVGGETGKDRRRAMEWLGEIRDKDGYEDYEDSEYYKTQKEDDDTIMANEIQAGWARDEGIEDWGKALRSYVDDPSAFDGKVPDSEPYIQARMRERGIGDDYFAALERRQSRFDTHHRFNAMIDNAQAQLKSDQALGEEIQTALLATGKVHRTSEAKDYASSYVDGLRQFRREANEMVQAGDTEGAAALRASYDLQHRMMLENLQEGGGAQTFEEAIAMVQNDYEARAQEYLSSEEGAAAIAEYQQRLEGVGPQDMMGAIEPDTPVADVTSAEAPQPAAEPEPEPVVDQVAEATPQPPSLMGQQPANPQAQPTPELLVKARTTQIEGTQGVSLMPPAATGAETNPQPVAATPAQPVQPQAPAPQPAGNEPPANQPYQSPVQPGAQDTQVAQAGQPQQPATVPGSVQEAAQKAEAGQPVTAPKGPALGVNKKPLPTVNFAGLGTNRTSPGGASPMQAASLRNANPTSVGQNTLGKFDTRSPEALKKV